ncbi:MAG: TetR/AcrR family transcriptional regulator [Rhodobacteraceae bacterium]|nr:TetR/AcrR family transcriptional regulator [Paracoccaceae bacterium]
MRLTEANKAKIRDRIIAGAAELFRKHGYDAVNLDRIMQRSDLTRGAFYAHFRSKSYLFEQVIRHEHPLLRMLAARSGTSAQDLRAEMEAIFATYLAPEHLEEVFAGCTAAALTAETARAPEPARRAYEAAWAAIVEEMARGQIMADAGALRAALILATGAVMTARAMADPVLRQSALEGAAAGFVALLRQAFGDRGAKRTKLQ